MESVAHNAVPPGTDLGALFGFGKAAPPRGFDNGWKGCKWEAPSRTPPPTTDGGRSWWSQNGPPQAPLGHEKPEQSTYSPAGWGQDFFSVPDPVETSKSTMEALLDPLAREDTSNEADIEKILRFLESTANEPDAQLTLRLVQWLGTKSGVPETTWSAVANNVRSRARVSEIGIEELTSICMHLLYDQPGGRELIPKFIRLPKAAHDVFPILTERILQASSDKQERQSAIIAWLAHIRPGKDFGTIKDNSTDPWYKLYHLLAQHFQPSDFPEHFGDIFRSKFGWALLRHWVPHYTAKSDDPTTEIADDVPMFAKATCKQFQPNGPRTSDIDYDTLCAKFSKLDEDPGAYILNDLVKLLAGSGLAYDRVVSEIIAVYTATQPDSRTKNLFIDLRRRIKGPPVPVETAVKLVQHFLASDLPNYALFIFRSMPSIPLQKCPDLPVKLIERGHTHGDRILDVLCRSTPDDTVSVEFRSQKRNGLTAEHVETVHKAAYAWACSPHVNSRIAYRRVWECYRLLRDRGAPISALMSRAMVKAGITRPLTVYGRLSRTQVQYIMSLVEAIEGQGTAVEVDKLVFEHWQRVLVKQGYTPGVRQDQEGKYWLHNRRLWQRAAIKRVAPPSAKSYLSWRTFDMARQPEDTLRSEQNVASRTTGTKSVARLPSTSQHQVVDAFTGTSDDPSPATTQVGRRSSTKKPIVRKMLVSNMPESWTEMYPFEEMRGFEKR